MKVKYSRFRHNAKQTSLTSPTGPQRQGGEHEHAQYPTNDDVTSAWSCRRPENVSILSSLILGTATAARTAKGIGLISKTKNLHLHHAFLYISLTSLHDYSVKVPEWLAARLAFPHEFVKEIGLTERKRGKTLGWEGKFITNYFINVSLRYRQVTSLALSQIFPEKLSRERI